jgi:hypothetical protein
MISAELEMHYPGALLATKQDMAQEMINQVIATNARLSDDEYFVLRDQLVNRVETVRDEMAMQTRLRLVFGTKVPYQQWGTATENTYYINTTANTYYINTTAAGTGGDYLHVDYGNVEQRWIRYEAAQTAIATNKLVYNYVAQANHNHLYDKQIILNDDMLREFRAEMDKPLQEANAHNDHLDAMKLAVSSTMGVPERLLTDNPNQVHDQIQIPDLANVAGLLGTGNEAKA